MADGDITTITELGRINIPGGGTNLGGGSKNNKVLVWGRLIATYDSLGLSLDNIGGITAFGVNKTDFLSLEVRQGGATATANPTDMKLFLAITDAPKDKIFIMDEVGADSPDEPSDAETFTVDWLVFGEDGRSPELV